MGSLVPPPSSAYLDAIQNRRSHHVLSNKSPISDLEVEEIVKTCMTHCPSAFNSQSTRAIILFKAEHEIFWSFVHDAMKAVVPEAAFPASAERLQGFKSGYGTILLFEDQEVVERLVSTMPNFAKYFPQWSENTVGIHQFAMWTALDFAGLGCCLQHYNPLIDRNVQETWDVPKSWALKGQLVFGSVVEAPHAKTFQPIEARLRSYGGC